MQAKKVQAKKVQAVEEEVNPFVEEAAEVDETPIKATETTSKHRPKKRGRVRGRLGALFLFILIAAVFFVIGNLSLYFGFIDIGHQLTLKNPLTQSAQLTEDEVSTRQLALRLEEVSKYLDGNSLYRYTQGDLDEATTKAINALLETSGDPYAMYFTPEQYVAYKQSSEGEYSGIGIVLLNIDGEITVLQVYEDSPANDAGVLPGDVILAVDGDRHDWELEEVTEAIHRPVGERVSILWRRGETERETVLTLREVNIPTIVSHLIKYEDQLFGYVYLRRFTAQSASELSEVLLQLTEEGAQGFILDLRGNPGGYLSQAIDVTSLFVSEGVVVQIEDRKGIEKRQVSGKAVTDKPLVVLINGGSASASELVSAALQDHKRAIIVGEVSYGKGTVQDVSELSWGGAIKYTIAHYLSPNGTTLDGVGVTPDILVSSSSESALEMPGTEDIITSGSYRYRESVDPQLDAALDVLRVQASEK